MRGILAAGAYLPHGRLDRSTIAPIVGSGGGKGTRTVASYDEDTTTMGFEAARLALKAAADDVLPDALWFSTVTPGYVDKTNATTIHAALRLDENVGAFDFGGAQRSVMGMLRAALSGSGTVLTVAADIRTGLPGGPDEAAGGDGASALLVGEGDGVIAEHLASASTTEEFVDRWRRPGEPRSKVWEERFGETRYLPLGEQAFQAALKEAELSRDQVDHLIVTGLHARAATALAKRLGSPDGHVVDTRAATVGNTGAAHPGLLLTSVLEIAEPGQVIALVVLADGADVVLLRTTEAITSYRSTRTLDDQVAAGAPVSYGKYLSWRKMLPVEPPRRPEPPRPSSSAAGRAIDWKFGFVGRSDPDSGAPQLPPLPSGTDPLPMADVPGTIVTFTVDRLAYSESPPIIFAVVDFDGGGRLPIELTDVAEEDVAPGVRVEMTFRKLFTSDDIHNYFWKARLVRGAA
ncbi:MAG TPA: OB-fold domain-containing protein [Acidimicrobiales bacterium]|nr:OB-fold domain-containing protein [Acidimicrobiales bacterium]